MSRRRIKRVPRGRTGIEWWRCPTCRTLKVQLIFQKVPPYDIIFKCTQCQQAWKADTGKILFGTKAELAVEQARRIQVRAMAGGMR